VAAAQAGGEAQVFPGGQVAFQPVDMATVGQVAVKLAACAVDRLRLPKYFARLGLAQATQGSQQGGFAAAVGAAQRDGLTASYRAAQAGLQAAVTAPQAEVVPLKFETAGIHTARWLAPARPLLRQRIRLTASGASALLGCRDLPKYKINNSH